MASDYAAWSRPTRVDRMRAVEAFYNDESNREWNRILRYPLEFALILHLLEQYLPSTGSILDLGGGPGRYSLWLAQKGFDVVLADLSNTNLKRARAEARKRRLSIRTILADAPNIASDGLGDFVAALVLGPLYHLPNRKDRLRTLRGIRGLLKPGGILITEHISVNSPLARSAAFVPFPYLANSFDVEDAFKQCRFRVLKALGLNAPDRYSLSTPKISILANPLWLHRVSQVVSENQDAEFWKSAELYIHVVAKDDNRLHPKRN